MVDVVFVPKNIKKQRFFEAFSSVTGHQPCSLCCASWRWSNDWLSLKPTHHFPSYAAMVQDFFRCLIQSCQRQPLSNESINVIRSKDVRKALRGPQRSKETNKKAKPTRRQKTQIRLLVSSSSLASFLVVGWWFFSVNMQCTPSSLRHVTGKVIEDQTDYWQLVRRKALLLGWVVVMFVGAQADHTWKLDNVYRIPNFCIYDNDTVYVITYPILSMYWYGLFTYV